MPVRIIITSGTIADSSQVSQLIQGIDAKSLLADRGYDTKNFFGIVYNMFMKRIEQIEKISDKKFQRIFGVERNTFFIILDKLNHNL